MADTLEKIQKASSDLPRAASTLRRHLATLSEVLTASRRTAEAWITDAEKLPYPDGLAEEAQRTRVRHQFPILAIDRQAGFI